MQVHAENINLSCVNKSQCSNWAITATPFVTVGTVVQTGTEILCEYEMLSIFQTSDTKLFSF